MTSGVVISGGDSPLNPLALPGSYIRREWSGQDGRTEPFAEGVRSKWNNYLLDIAQRDVTSNKFVRSRWVNYPDAVNPVWVDTTDEYPITIQNYYPPDSNIVLRAQNKLLAKARGHSFNLAVNTAELGKTISMVSSTLQKICKSFLALKRGDFVTAARQLGARPKTTRLKTKDVSGRWLELQYGWVPLLDQCFEASKAYEAISNGPRSSTFRASSKAVRIFVGSVGPIRWDERHLRRVNILFEMYEEMQLQRQLGLTDPLTVLWEVLPYSFVVDWFVPIGTYLENLNSIPKLVGRFLTTSSYETSTSNIRPTLAFDAVPFLKAKQLPGVIFQRKYIERTSSTSLSVPSPSFDRGGLQSGHRVKNAIALAYNVFGLASR